jgi:cell division protein ZapA (FtsZ GTPase activity inhibitor)
MTLAEQFAQLRELARLSSGTRMLDMLIINLLDEMAQAVGRLERSEPQGQTRSRQRSGDGTSPAIDPQQEGSTAYDRPPARLEDQQAHRWRG